MVATTVGPNTSYPGYSEWLFVPDGLIAGDAAGHGVTQTVTILTGGSFKRGAVLGLITASGKYTLALSASADGSQTPAAVLLDDADATGGDVTAPILVGGIEVNSARLILGTGITLTALKTAWARGPIFIKDSMSAAPPT